MSIRKAIDTLQDITSGDIEEQGIGRLDNLVGKLQAKIVSYKALEVLRESGCTQNLLNKIVTIENDVCDDLDLVTDKYEVDNTRVIQFENCTLSMFFRGKGKIYKTNNDYSVEMDYEFIMGLYDDVNGEEYDYIDDISSQLHELLFGETIDPDIGPFRDEIMRLTCGMEEMDTEIGCSGYFEDALEEYKWWEKKPDPKMLSRQKRIRELKESLIGKVLS